MVRPKFAPKSTPYRGPIAKPHHLPHPWARPTYDAKRHSDPIRRFYNALDRQTDGHTDRPTDRSRKSLMAMGRCAPRATRPNNTVTVKIHDYYNHTREITTFTVTRNIAEELWAQIILSAQIELWQLQNDFMTLQINYTLSFTLIVTLSSSTVSYWRIIMKIVPSLAAGVL